MNNSLFEDNAEFGLGMRLSADKQLQWRHYYAEKLKPELGEDFIAKLSMHKKIRKSNHQTKRKVEILKIDCNFLKIQMQKHLYSLADHLVHRAVWLIGGDGWAYDIGSGGLDHALSTGRNINVLGFRYWRFIVIQVDKVLKLHANCCFCEICYSGQNVWQKIWRCKLFLKQMFTLQLLRWEPILNKTLLAMREAEAYDGPSLNLAYSHCIAHGIDMVRFRTNKNGCSKWLLAID